MKVFLNFIVVAFVVFCGWLVIDSGLFEKSSLLQQGCILLQQRAANEKQAFADAPARQNEGFEVASFTDFSAVGGPEKTIILAATDPNTEDHETGFKFQLELSSKGAAIRKVTFSNGPHNGRPSGFNDRDPKNPQPLVFLSPISYDEDTKILSLANKQLILLQQQRQLALDRLSWKSFDVETREDGSQTAHFEAIIKNSADELVFKLTKTYKVTPGSYLLECSLTIENLSELEQEVSWNLTGPVGINREAFRSDARKVMAGLKNSEGQINSVGLNLRKLAKAETLDDKRLETGPNFLWAAAVNKYFAAILVPLPDEGKSHCDWVTDKIGSFYNPDGDSKADSGDETIGLDLKVVPSKLSPTNQHNSSRTYNFQLYLGPKDKSLFDKNENYRRLGFVQTIDFMPCFCCPASIINPLAFGILALMKWMYSFIGNYGIVIIILVFLMRLVMHPITKKSQVSMSKMSKLAPKTEEIKKKYANNKTEMNKQLMALYREQGASPIMGMLPMMVQMPIWIALWGAVYSSIDLRGAAFLPFWITDLSTPDALVRFTAITIPLLGWKIESLNLLPILMGVAFYLQQKLMPSQAQASTNPQVAQQQKMMMIMLPLLFPLMLYKAPSGVNLYIMASTFAGVIEQHVIRKHIRKKEEEELKGLVSVTSKTGGKVKKKKPKPFFRV
jgi:YidC/Oxa1 family membrane protein insertase